LCHRGVDSFEPKVHSGVLFNIIIIFQAVENEGNLGPKREGPKGSRRKPPAREKLVGEFKSHKFHFPPLFKDFKANKVRNGNFIFLLITVRSTG